MIVDALTHVHPQKEGFGARYDASVDFLVENLLASPVDKAVITAIAADTAYGTDSEYVAECCRRYPGHLLGFASVDPIRDPNAVDMLKRYVEELGLRGLKLHPRHQRLSVEDPRVVPVVEMAVNLGIPVAICGSLWKGTPLKDQVPLNIDTLCKRVPEAKVIICHSGGFHFMDAFVVAVANDNVFLETSITLNYFHGTPFEEQYMFTLKQLGADRIIYGSDHPEDPVKVCYARSKKILESHGFTEEECAKIFGANILSLIGE